MQADDPPRPLVPAAAPAVALQACANCGTPGSGRFCGACGQRLDVHLHSLGHFTSEAAEVITHSDSSLWATLSPLLRRPGWLTREFVAGRRVRYLHPFRLYLVASLLAWLAVHAVGLGEARVVDRHGATAAQAASGTAGPAKPSPVAGAEPEGPDCDAIRSDVPGLEQRLQSTCRSIKKDGGRTIGREFAHNLGRAMFVFLPLLAGFMKLLYWRPRRYYLEHLLLLLHNHAALYLMTAIVVLVAHWLPWEFASFLLWVVAIGYAVRYVYRSMREYYGQHGAITFGKFLAVGLAYLVAGSVMVAIASYLSIEPA